MRTELRSLIALGTVVSLAACAQEPTSPPNLTGPAATLIPSAGLPIYGVGGPVRGAPAEPCAEPMHRQFDFWLGAWDVFDPDGTQVGTNVITSELDGCVIAESWVGAGGVPGRSINTFDVETGQWHQTWVTAAFSGHLRMAGGIDEQGRMVLAGSREAVIQGFTLFDEYVWTVLGPDRVQQVGTVEVPAVGFEGEFVGIYERRPEVTPAPETPTTGCQPGGASEQSRQLDFWLGDWHVAAAHGPALGRSKVTADQSGCLIEERFQTPKGYEAVSFAYFDFWEQRWFRTFIDGRGERLELAGEVNGGPGPLTGTEAGPGSSGDLLVRVNLTQLDANRVRQLWEVSRDGGDRWQRALDLLYTQR